MATKKTRSKNQNMAFDPDLDFNFDDDMFSFSNEAEKKQRGVVSQVVRGVISGAKSKIMDTSTWTGFAKKALPQEYEHLAEASDAIGDTYRKLYDDGSKKLRPELRSMGRNIDRLVPEEARRLKALAKQFIGDDQGYSSQPGKSSYEDDSIRNSQDAIFNQSTAATRRIQARRNVEKGIEGQIELKRHGQTMGVLTNISSSIDRLVGYTTTVTSAYQRKSLELQFRSYFALAETQRTTAKFFESFQKQNEAIIANTAMPEFVKLRNSERFSELARNRLMGGIQDSMFGSKSTFGKGLARLQTTFSNYINEIQEKLSMANLAMDSVANARDMEKQFSEFDGGGNSDAKMLGELLGELGVGEGAKALGSRAKGKLDPNSRLGKALYTVLGVVTNPGGSASRLKKTKWMQDAELEGGLKGKAAKAANFLLGHFEDQAKETKLTDRYAVGGLNPSVFDRRAHAALTNVIPALLARQLREITMLRTGKDSELIEYDYGRERFISVSKMSRGVTSDIKSSINRTMFGYNADEASKAFHTEDSTASDRAITRAFMGDLSGERNLDMTPESIRGSKAYKRLSPEERGIIDSRLDEILSTKKGQYEFAASIEKIRRETPDLRGIIGEHLNEGRADALRRARILRTSKDGSMSVRESKINSLFREVLLGGVVDPRSKKRKGLFDSDFIPTDDMTRGGGNIPSDRNIKENIQTTNPRDFLDAIEKMKGYRYNYKGDKEGHTKYGHMAQEVKANLGDWAAPNGKAINVEGLLMANTQAIRGLRMEQKDQMDNPTATKLLRKIHADTSKMVKLMEAGGGYGGGRGGDGDFVPRSLMDHLYLSAKKGGRRVLDMLGRGGNAMGDLARWGKETAFPFAMGIGRKVGDRISDEYTKQRLLFPDRMDRFSNWAKDTYDEGRHTLRSVSASASEMFQNARSSISNIVNKPIDLMSKTGKRILVRADLLAKGEYFDENGTVISTMKALRDLKGDLYNKAGKRVATAKQLAEGTLKGLGKSLNDHRINFTEKLVDRFKSSSNAAIRFGANAIDIAKDLGGTIKDKLKDSGLMDKLKGFDFGFGFGNKKVIKLLTEIRDILKGGAGGGGTTIVDGSGNGSEGGLVDANGRPISSGYTGSAADALKTAGSAAGMAKKGVDAIRSGAGKFQTFASDKWSKRPSWMGKNLGGGKLGKTFGKVGSVVGGLTSVVGSGISGGLGAISNLAGGQNQELHGPAPEMHGPIPPQGFVTENAKRAGVLDSIKSKLKTILPQGQRKFNDTDGDGRREGDWRTRLEEMQARRSKDTVNRPGDPEAAKYGASMSSMVSGLSKLFGTAGGVLKGLTGSFGELAAGAAGLFATIKGKLGLGKAAAGAAGAASGVAGAAAKGGFLARAGQFGASALGVLTGVGKAGAGASKAARLAIMARNAAVVGALVTTGPVSAILGAGALASTLIGAAISSPVVISAAVIAGASYLGYKAYKYFTRNRLNNLEEIRVRQYGFTSSMSSYNHKLMELEGYFLDNRIGYTATGPVILERKVDIKEIMKIMAVDEGDTDGVRQLSAWLHGRFLPFFLNSVGAVHAADKKVKLSDADDLEGEARLTYLRNIKFESGPYGFQTPPLKEMGKLDSNRDECIKLIEDELNSSYTHEQRMSKTNIGKVLAADLDAGKKRMKDAEDTQRKADLEQKRRENDAKRDLANFNNRSNGDSTLPPSGRPPTPYFLGGPKPAANDLNINGPVSNDSEPEKLGNQGSGVGAGRTQTSSTVPPAITLRSASGPLADGSSGQQYVKFANGATLNGANPSMVKNFYAMVQEYGELTGKQVQVNSGHRSFQQQMELYRRDPTKAARPGRSLHEYGLAIDIQSVDAEALESLGLMRKYGFTRPIGHETWHLEPAGIQSDIQRAKNDPVFASRAVEFSLGRGGGGYGTMGKGNDIRKGGRNQELALSLIDARVTQVDNAPGSNDEKYKTLTSNYQKGSDNLFLRVPKVDMPLPGHQEDMTKKTATAGDLLSIDQRSIAGSSNIGPQVFTPDDAEVSPDSGGSESDSPDTSSRAGILEAIGKYAAMAGVPGPMMKVMAAIESSLDVYAKNMTTQAEGPFQFLPGTWKEQMAKHASKYGLKGDERPTNLKAATLMAAEYIKSNLATLKSVRSNAGPVEAYLTHFLGASGASTLLSANPNDIAATVRPAAAKSNPGIFYDNGRPRTVKEVIDLIGKRIQAKASEFGITGVSIGSSPITTQTASNDPIGPGRTQTAPASAPGLPTMNAGYENPSSGGMASIAPKATPTNTPIREDISFGNNHQTSSASNGSGDGTVPYLQDLVKASKEGNAIGTRTVDLLTNIRDLIETMVNNQSSGTGPAKAVPITQASKDRRDYSEMLDYGRRRA